MEQQRREDVQRVQQSIRTALRLANEDGVREPNEDLEDLDFECGDSPWVMDSPKRRGVFGEENAESGNRSWKYDELWFCDGF